MVRYDVCVDVVGFESILVDTSEGNEEENLV